MREYEAYRTMVENHLKTLLPDRGTPEDGLRQAERYSLLAGGKRVRAVLVLEFCRVCGGDVNAALDVAAAVELVHTYSLVHDDLPCMDDDVLRRGKPTNHTVYGVCNATLAGDALQADAFALLARAKLPPERIVRCTTLLADAAGSMGMCAGQYLDMNPSAFPTLDADALTHLQSCKTGALILGACMLGVAAAGGDRVQMSAASAYGGALGLAFQIRDDLLDASSSAGELGKSAGKDAQSGKQTFLTLLGEDACRERVELLTKKACAALNNLDESDFLRRLATTLSVRRN